MIKSKVAVITGACGAIGTAISERLGADGWRLLLIDISEDVHRKVERLNAAGLLVKGIQLDISKKEEVDRLSGMMGDWYQDVSALVNNAGISPKFNGIKRDVLTMPADEWSRVIDVNLTGTFLITQTLLRPMIDKGWGRVVMIASQAARTRTRVPAAHYQASKAGMVGLARVLAGEVAKFGVTVNSVAPGRVESEMTAKVSDAANLRIAEDTPIERMGKPQEIAGAVAYLCSEDASYSVGAILDINGGHFMP